MRGCLQQVERTHAWYVLPAAGAAAALGSGQVIVVRSVSGLDVVIFPLYVSAACVVTGLSVLRVVIYVEIESTHANTAAMPSKVFVIILLIVRPSPRARTPAGSCVSMELERRRTGSDFL